MLKISFGNAAMLKIDKIINTVLVLSIVTACFLTGMCIKKYTANNDLSVIHAKLKKDNSEIVTKKQATDIEIKEIPTLNNYIEVSFPKR